jgi:hypothetical protein
MKLRPLAAGIIDCCWDLHLQSTEVLTHYDLATQPRSEAKIKEESKMKLGTSYPQLHSLQSTEWKATLHKT